MISVDEALRKVLDLATLMPSEMVPLNCASGRVLAKSVYADRNQPPFSASVMDGYAVRNDEVHAGASFTVVGEAAAGHGFDGEISAGEALRIFTGAPVPDSADRVIIQEDVTRDGNRITLNDNFDKKAYVRPAGADFQVGSEIAAPRILRPADVALLASMNIAEVPVSKRPVVALIATGDELVMPGEAPAPDQIIASNTFGLQALLSQAGADARMLPIAKDTVESLNTAFDLASDADLIVTIGGASVGDHDLVGAVAADLGLERAFYKIAMRPGKPLMAGRIGKSVMIGLPGNPVSSMVCGQIFVQPLVQAMLGLPAVQERLTANLACDLPANGIRAHYMRAQLTDAGITPFERQDSALLSILTTADALLIRPVGDPARQAGDTVEYLPLG